jgi:hypothetical protein
MTHFTCDDPIKIERDESIDIVCADNENALLQDVFLDSHQRARLPRAKHDERLSGGIRPEQFFGICAEEFDDEFMDSLRAIRRGGWSRLRP